MELVFTKMQGCANDYIYMDCRLSGVPAAIEELSVRLSRRHFSIGADGIICICAPQCEDSDAMMRIFNADGSEGKMCGNGIRCVAQWLVEHDPLFAGRKELRIDTLSGTKTLTRTPSGLWQVEMGVYKTLPQSIPAVNMGEAPLVGASLTVEEKEWTVTCINVGNPHCVTVVEDTASLELEKIGPGFEKHANFPENINTEFVQVLGPQRLRMRVWERGSGETWACGTGTCACAAAMVELGICSADKEILVELLGGELSILVRSDGSIRMTGPAETVYEGEVAL